MSTVDVITVISILMIVVIAWRVCGKEDLRRVQRRVQRRREQP